MSRQLEFVERAGVDEMYGDAERNAEYHTEQRQDETPGVFAQRARGYRIDCESE